MPMSTAGSVGPLRDPNADVAVSPNTTAIPTTSDVAKLPIR